MKEPYQGGSEGTYHWGETGTCHGWDEGTYQGEKIENNKPEYNLSLLFNKSYLNMIIIYNILTISSNINIYK